MSVGEPEVKISFMGLGNRWLANVGTGLDKYGMDTEPDRLQSTDKFQSWDDKPTPEPQPKAATQ